jgi:hypothetical protein
VKECNAVLSVPLYFKSPDTDFLKYVIFNFTVKTNDLFISLMLKENVPKNQDLMYKGL